MLTHVWQGLFGNTEHACTIICVTAVPVLHAACAVRSTSAPAQRPLMRSSSDGGRDFVLENKHGAAAPLRPARPEKKEEDGSKYLAKRDYGRVRVGLCQRLVACPDQGCMRSVLPWQQRCVRLEHECMGAWQGQEWEDALACYS